MGAEGAQRGSENLGKFVKLTSLEKIAKNGGSEKFEWRRSRQGGLNSLENFSKSAPPHIVNDRSLMGDAWFFGPAHWTKYFPDNDRSQILK